MKKFFRAKICVPAPLVATSVLTQNKRARHGTPFLQPPPPSFAGRPCQPPPPPPPAKQFSGRPGVARSLHSAGDNLSGSRFRAVQCCDDPTVAVVADLTRSEDWQSLKPGHAVGDCHARRLPSVHQAQRLSAAEDSAVNTEAEMNQRVEPTISTIPKASEPTPPCCSDKGVALAGASKGQVRTHHFAPAAPAVTQPSWPTCRGRGGGGGGRMRDPFSLMAGASYPPPPLVLPHPQGRRSPTTPWGMVTK